MKRYLYCVFIISHLVSCSQAKEGIQEYAKPNVILVMTDDQGYGDMSCHGHPFLNTPNIDKLYRESTRLTNFHVDPTCSPTRAALLTGKYSSRTGVWHTLQGRSIMDKDETTIAQVFSQNGYKTGIFGKWHLGDNFPYRPEDRGFQEVLSFGGGGVGQNPDYWRNDYFDDIYIQNGKHKLFKGYSTDTWFENAIQFIENNKDDPFFCYIPTNAPHFWYNVEEKYSEPFRKMGMDDYYARFNGMIVNLDENLGKLLQKVDELGLKDNTIIIFMTDNGQSAWNLPANDKFYYNAGMRGRKTSVYDGGHRVPFFIRWPKGGIEGGKNIDALTAHIDLFPTLIDLCKLRYDQQTDLDGRSLTPLLKDSLNNWPERVLSVHNQRVETPVKWRNFAVMTERWRFINGNELYDIQKDPSQKHNVKDKNPEITKRLRSEYNKWWLHISERFDEYSRIYIGTDEENPAKLTGHDWHSDKPLNTWSQEDIMNRKHGNGFWAIEIAKAGQYEFTLRTYPTEEDTRLNIQNVRIKIGPHDVEKECYPGSSEVKFILNLEPGKTELRSWMRESDGTTFGAPFIYVKRL